MIDQARAARASSCCTTRCSSWRARSRCEVRGPDSVRALLAPGRGRGSSVSSLVCYLIGPLAHRSDREQAGARALPARGPARAARHRPRLPARHPRGADPARARALRRASTRRSWRPSRRSARAVRSASSARCSACRRARSSAWRAAPSATGRAPSTTSATAHGHGQGSGEGSARPGGAPRSERWRWLERLVEEAHGLPRHLSQHSGGMIISTRPLIDCCPVVPAAMEGRQMVQWDKDSCADAGFLKIDLLGLGMLSAVERCVEDDRARARTSASTSRASTSTIRRRSRRSARPTPSASSRSRAVRRCSRCCARARRTSTT